jgi:hypothetical protein
LGWQQQTVETSQTSTAEGRPATARTPGTVETPTTVLALAGGTPTTTVWSPTTHDCSGGNREKLVRKAKNL